MSVDVPRPEATWETARLVRRTQSSSTLTTWRAVWSSFTASVRVIGNEAVHPGTIDLKDDRDSALNLFRLVNAIAEQMISHEKSVNDMYAMLPEGKRNAIEARNEEAKKGD